MRFNLNEKRKLRKQDKLKREFLRYYRHTEDPEIIEMIQHIKRTGKFEMMNCLLSRNYDYTSFQVDVIEDKTTGLKYVWDESGKRIFFPRNKTKEAVEEIYRAIKKEQDIYSPHCYLNEEDVLQIKKAHEGGKYIRIFELGAAEALFSLSLLEYADEVHIFESNQEWIEALYCTFGEEKHKVKITNKYVTDVNNNDEISLDWYIKGLKKVEDVFDIVKMDIEGAEVRALAGMKEFIQPNHKFMAFVCAYHGQDDEKKIREIFTNYPVENTRGFFCFYTAEDYWKPYVRRCLLKVKNI